MNAAGGKAISDKLWQHKCGCIEAVRPYRLYPCKAHRKSHSWMSLSRSGCSSAG